MTGATRPFAHPSRIRFIDTGAPGRIHCSAIFRRCGTAETELFCAPGHPYAGIEGRDVVLPRVHVEAPSHAALHAGDPLEIEVGAARVGQRPLTPSFAALCRGIKSSLRRRHRRSDVQADPARLCAARETTGRRAGRVLTPARFL